MARAMPDDVESGAEADWHRRVVGRSLRTARERSFDRGMNLIRGTRAVQMALGGGFLWRFAGAARQPPTLYQYFESKDDLSGGVRGAMRTYAQMIGRAVADLDDPLTGWPARSCRPPHARLAVPATGPPGCGSSSRSSLTWAGPVGRDGARRRSSSGVGRGRIMRRTPRRDVHAALAQRRLHHHRDLGNDGLRRPTCSRSPRSACGLGAEVADWLADINARLRLPACGRRACRTARLVPRQRPLAG
jgi:hypothetical protein